MYAWLQDCLSRGLVVDIAAEKPAEERVGNDKLKWQKPRHGTHVQMTWIDCQRRSPSEAAVLKQVSYASWQWQWLMHLE